MTTVDLSWKLRAQKAEADNRRLLKALNKCHAVLYGLYLDELSENRTGSYSKAWLLANAAIAGKGEQK